MSEGQGGWGQQPGGQQPGWVQQPPPPPPQQAWGAPPPQAWGAPPHDGYGQPAKPSNGLAVGSLIAGIIAFFTGWIFVGIVIGIAAIVMGFLALRKPGGRGLAIGGIITGGLGIVFGAIVLVVVVFAADSVSKFSDLGDCLNNAGNDTVKQQDCQDQFSNSFGN